MTDKVFTPIQVGKMTLDHRFAMAPMTRSRATFDGVQTPLAADYYGQRAADMGLLITEGVYPSLQGQGNHETPGLATAEHVAAWQPVTKAVHENGGYIFVQLQHAGVMTHPENAPARPAAIAPSAAAPGVDIYTPNGAREIPVPNEATVEDLATAVAQFRQAARNAIDAGADGVEIQGANGFLLHQFFGIESNLRQDNYGGSLENRIRFTLEVVAAVADEIGAEKTALRLSPLNPTVPFSEGDDALTLYELLLDKLSDLDLAFVELRVPDVATLAALRAHYTGVLVANVPGLDLNNRLALVEEDLADVLSIGVLSMANPDFVARLRVGAGFNEADFSTVFGGGAQGYTDYPTLG